MIAAPRFTQCIDYDPGLPGITVSIELSLNSTRVVVAAKLDTGASACIFARTQGEALGLDIESGLPRRILTVTGGFQTYRHELTLTVADFRFDVGVYFAADDAFHRDVVGRHGFLDRLNVGLIDYEGKLYLGPYGEPEKP